MHTLKGRTFSIPNSRGLALVTLCHGCLALSNSVFVVSAMSVIIHSPAPKEESVQIRLLQPKPNEINYYASLSHLLTWPPQSCGATLLELQNRIMEKYHSFGYHPFRPRHLDETQSGQTGNIRLTWLPLQDRINSVHWMTIPPGWFTYTFEENSYMIFATCQTSRRNFKSVVFHWALDSSLHVL